MKRLWTTEVKFFIVYAARPHMSKHQDKHPWLLLVGFMTYSPFFAFKSGFTLYWFPAFQLLRQK